MKKGLKSVLSVFTGCFLVAASLSASATVTLDNVTDYYLYGTLIETEFEIDNHVAQQINQSSETVLVSEPILLVAEEVSNGVEVAYSSAE
ncbi:hypothetical protein [Planctobacterium marinum]|uniref:hypothetical protein n=1 Tax=Planctobacterium marinum TaxID=1631968 RepID=UPI001E471987|nr:hypothetical protein [Planctobacterium marinum]MCC2607415.1 hypothetical protein [Planctobacterium marinum]